jgi:uncharacterized protein (DUF1330 family)
MKLTAIALASSLVVGLSAHAEEAKKPVYFIGEVKISNMDAFRAYATKAAETVARFHGRILARAKPEAKEGAVPEGIVVLWTFDSADDGQKWWDSPEYQALIPERQKASQASIFTVEGLP